MFVASPSSQFISLVIIYYLWNWVLLEKDWQHFEFTTNELNRVEGPTSMSCRLVHYFFSSFLFLINNNSTLHAHKNKKTNKYENKNPFSASVLIRTQEDSHTIWWLISFFSSLNLFTFTSHVNRWRVISQSNRSLNNNKLTSTSNEITNNWLNLRKNDFTKCSLLFYLPASLIVAKKIKMKMMMMNIVFHAHLNNLLHLRLHFIWKS